MGRDCCGTDLPHDHGEEMDDQTSEPVLVAPSLPSEIQKTVITAGSGGYPRPGDDVRVHYTGWLQDGTKFDSSRDRGQLFSFRLGGGQVIKGWDLGVATMQRGEKARFSLPPAYAYGASGSPPTIPPDATLDFEIELFSFGGRDLFGDGRVTFHYLTKSKDWKAPREGDEVVFELSNVSSSPSSPSNEGGVFTHTLNKQTTTTTTTTTLSSRLLDALLTELKLGDVVRLEINEAEAVKNGGITAATLKVTAINKVDDVSFSAGAKRVMKKTLTPGEGYQTPELQSAVTVAVTVSNSESFVLASNDNFSFTMGEGRVAELIEAAVAKMTLNETALVWTSEVDGVAAEAEQQSVLNYPVENGLQFKIILKSFSESKPYYDRTAEEKRELGDWLKTAGTRVLKEGRLKLAVEKYKQIVKMFEFKDDSEAADLLKAARLNLAMCYVKLGDWRAVKEETSKVLKEDPENVKALFREATARFHLGELPEAEKLLKKAIEIDGTNGEARHLLAAVREAVKKDKEKEKNLLGRMFKAVGRD